MYLCRESEKVLWYQLDYFMYTLRFMSSFNDRIPFMRLCDDWSVWQHGCVLLLYSGTSEYHSLIAIATAVRALGIVKTWHIYWARGPWPTTPQYVSNTWQTSLQRTWQTFYSIFWFPQVHYKEVQVVGDKYKSAHIWLSCLSVKCCFMKPSYILSLVLQTQWIQPWSHILYVELMQGFVTICVQVWRGIVEETDCAPDEGGIQCC
jgi:hypothetical protein